MSRRKKYRLFLAILILGGICGSGMLWIEQWRKAIPDTMKVSELDDCSLGLGWFITEELTPELTRVSTGAHQYQEYGLVCKMLGVIPLKTVAVEIEKIKSVYPGGIPIGLYMETDGVYVVACGSVKGQDGKYYKPAEKMIQSGDYILAVDGKMVREKEILTSLLADSQTSNVMFTVKRGTEILRVKLELVEDSEGDLKAGIWVRDNAQGIGTLTFLTEDRMFGALGHGIHDMDTGELLHIAEGALYEAEIVSISKGENGSPGELCGTIHYRKECKVGEITDNLPVGIYGTSSNKKMMNMLEKGQSEIAWKQEVKKGKAWVRSAVRGEIEDYEIEISETRYGESDVNKGIVFRVTDDRLLEYTGGIVQGMSGSPILQGGKLVGAVTHVFVQDSSKGFGIFIENMLDCVAY